MPKHPSKTHTHVPKGDEVKVVRTRSDRKPEIDTPAPVKDPIRQVEQATLDATSNNP